MFRRIFLISIFLALSCSGLAVSEHWPCFHRSADRTGASAESVNPPLSLAWQFQAGGPISSSPAIVDGVVYFGCDYGGSGKVFAVDANTGVKKWEYPTPGRVGSSPAVHNGVVFICDMAGYLYALNANSGAVIWTYSNGGQGLSSPLVSDGRVYCGFGWPSKNLVVLDEITGAVIRQIATNQPVQSSAAISGNMVVFGANDGYYRCFDKDTYASKWQFFTPGGVYRSTPAISGNSAFFAPGDFDRKIYSVNLTTGAQQWAFTVPTTVSWQAISYVSSPAVANGVVYIAGGCPTQTVYALDALTGTKLWEHGIGNVSPMGFASSPIISGDYVYIGAANGYLYALNKDTGQEAWSTNVASSILSTAAISQGGLYIGDEDGKLSCYTIHTFTSPTDFVQPGWNLFSLPGIPADPNPVSLLSSTDISDSGLQYWRNDLNGGGYQVYGDIFEWTGPLVPKTPYWFYERNAAGTLSFKGYLVNTDQTIVIPAHDTAPYWAMIGHPFDHATPCSAVTVSTPSHPEPIPWLQTYANQLMYSGAIGFESSNHRNFITGPTELKHERDTLQPWYGYWLMILTTEPLTIHIPVGAVAP